MTGLYARWMDRWERKLATRDTNRVVRPFEWGTDWLHGSVFPTARRKPMARRAACLSPFAARGARAIPTASTLMPPVGDYQLAARAG